MKGRKKYRKNLGEVKQQQVKIRKKEDESLLNDTDKKILRTLAYVGGGILITTAGFFLVRHISRNRKANKAEKESLVDNTSENFAKRLKMAFDNDGWWGTDVEGVRRVFVQIPDKKAFKEVMLQYKNLTRGGNLIVDLTDELTTTEYYEMQNILSAKPDAPGKSSPNTEAIQARTFARRLNAAVNYKVMGMPSTDEDAIRQVLTEISSKRMWEFTKYAYRKDFGLDLENELDDDLGIFDFSWRDMIKKKPQG